MALLIYEYSVFAFIVSETKNKIAPGTVRKVEV